MQMSSLYDPLDLDQPAGSRVPKPFKKTFEDKLPEWIDKFRQEGVSDAEINEIIKGKTAKYIGKWGNTSKVGVLINNYNSAYANEIMRQETRDQAPKTKQTPTARKRVSSLPAIEQRNSATISGKNRRTKSTTMNKQLRNSQKIKTTYDNDDYAPFQTTNQRYHEVLEQQDFTSVKKNFKKKTPFTQWSNAYFSGGVHFNPPTSGI